VGGVSDADSAFHSNRRSEPGRPDPGARSMRSNSKGKFTANKR
jgi:hypothetical protein